MGVKMRNEMNNLVRNTIIQFLHTHYICLYIYIRAVKFNYTYIQNTLSNSSYVNFYFFLINEELSLVVRFHFVL